MHCCASDVPIDLIRTAGAGFVSIDLTWSDEPHRNDDALGRAWESGLGILAGCVPSTSADEIGEARASAPLRVLHRLGLEDPVWLEQVAVTPACGLAGASPAWRPRIRRCARARRQAGSSGTWTTMGATVTTTGGEGAGDERRRRRFIRDRPG